MIYFTTFEILCSIIYGALYGVLFAFLFSILGIIRFIISDILQCLKQIFIYKSIRDKIYFDSSFYNVCRSSAGVIFEIIVFTLGFIVVSYATLDGLVRGYMLIVISAAVYVSKNAFSLFFDKVFIKIFHVFLACIVKVFRVLLYPVCNSCRKITLKFIKNNP